MNSRQSPLFFSYTYKFLHEYLVKDLGKSEKTEISYTDALTLFRRELLKNNSFIYSIY